METLAGIFVAIVTAANALAPQANIPQVLGVETVATQSSSVRKNELLEKARLRREEIKKNIETRRLEVKEKIQNTREEFKERVANIKDERKQSIVENVDERLSHLNEVWTDHWNSVLTRLTEILAKIESRSTKLASTGKDVTTVNTAIANAKTAIATAQTVVNTQAGKTYVINITGEDTLREDVQTVVNQFKADAKVAKEIIQTAREAVTAAFRTLASVSGEGGTQ